MFNDLTSKKFGKLTVLQLDHKEQCYDTKGNKHGQKYYWLCQCECGNQKIIDGRNLTSKHSTSCGCNYYTQGNKTHTRLYKILEGIKGRCNYPKNNRYKNYGARGIKLCQEWNDFKVFEKWALDNGYANDLTIDRIDNNGDYEPNNCRWVSLKEQARNKKNNHLLTFQDKTLSIAEWAEITGIKAGTIYSRINKYKWTIKRALTTPKKRANGEN